MSWFTASRTDRLLVLALGALFLGAGLYAAFLPWKAAILPVLLALVGLALAGALYRQLGRHGVTHTGPAFAPEDSATYLWYLTATVLVLGFGFEIGGFLFGFAYFRWSARLRWIASLLLAVPIPTAAYLAFDVLLNRPSFDGLLGIHDYIAVVRIFV